MCLVTETAQVDVNRGGVSAPAEVQSKVLNSTVAVDGWMYEM